MLLNLDINQFIIVIYNQWILNLISFKMVVSCSTSPTSDIIMMLLLQGYKKHGNSSDMIKPLIYICIYVIEFNTRWHFITAVLWLVQYVTWIYTCPCKYALTSKRYIMQHTFKWEMFALFFSVSCSQTKHCMPL